jgi:indolepyruvate ferredoxin oxidoreductase alpha subunit
MTGHQDNPGSGWNLMGDEAPMLSVEKILDAYGYAPVITVDPQDLTAMKKAVDDAVQALNEGKHPAIVTRRPCLLYKRPKHDIGLCTVDPDKCKSCKSCLKVGCPAIAMENGKAVIDKTQCVGCTVCAQACPFNAIHREEK